MKSPRETVDVATIAGYSGAAGVATVERAFAPSPKMRLVGTDRILEEDLPRARIIVQPCRTLPLRSMDADRQATQHPKK